MSEFVTDLGMIKGRKETGLSARNQRLLARAIKRCQAMGLLPYTYALRKDDMIMPKLRKRVN
jgi:small subunit ribosomal protein S18